MGREAGADRSRGSVVDSPLKHGLPSLGAMAAEVAPLISLALRSLVASSAATMAATSDTFLFSSPGNAAKAAETCPKTSALMMSAHAWSS